MKTTLTQSPYVQAMVRRAYVEILGVIWLPPITCAQVQKLSDYDLENIGDFTRENVEQWLGTHAGDFQSVTDFHAQCGEAEIAWQSEENELAFYDCMNPSED